MNETTNARHEPEPEFLEHLAWQTRTALRREERFARSTGGSLSASGAKLRTLALVLVSVLGGAATVVAAEHLQERRELQRLLAGIELRIETATLRFDHVREEAARSRVLYEAGVISDTELFGLETEALQHEQELKRLELDRDEIVSSGHEPREDLSAPLIHGRDYVTERLELRARGLREALNAARLRSKRVEMLVETGRVPSSELEDARLAATVAESELDRIEERMELRRRHLAGATSPQEVELLGMRAEVVARAEVGAHRVEHARRTHEILAVRAREGLTNGSEARRAQLELRELEAELKLANLELAGIDARLGR